MATVDILAPAGSLEMLTAAVFAGADSVYLGISGFNARRSAENFTLETLPGAVAFCHARNVKVNVAVNTVASDSELARLAQVLAGVAKSGADAVILQDMAAAKLARAVAPGLALHASTQMSVTSLSGARLLAEAGFSRVILARELTATEIAHITANCGIETEIFVHGAHCMCVSGQCYMSAFFGGRSGNRGACAGPCRLPYTAFGQTGPLLSLKDLSLVEHLPQIAAMGVTCVKIEGRLRTPEYVAAAVSAARCALENKPYDAALLEKAFSRAGFTAGFYENDYLNGDMFGRRTEADGAATKAALPALRQLYRRERQSVPVDFSLSMGEDSVCLSVTDGTRTEQASAPAEFSPAEKDLEPAVRRSLEKCGGTPFYARSVVCSLQPGVYFPLSVVNELRRRVLEALLAARERIPAPPAEGTAQLPAPRTARPAPLALWARFADAAQLTDEAAGLLAGWTVPLGMAAKLPERFREKTVLALPRAIFEEQELEQQLLAAAALGFHSFEVQSVCGLGLVKRTLPAAQLRCGFGCNITNTLAQQAYEEWGACATVLSPELSLETAGAIGGSVPRGVLAYGHLPLMLVRACPIRGVTSCAACRGKGTLEDRKGEQIAVECLGQGENGSRELLNPVPLWLGDRKRELGVEFALLYFTRETPCQAAALTAAFAAGEQAEGPFTRGLGYKNIFAAQD